MKWGHRCNYLILCHSCHAGPFASMPHAKQLAVKKAKDPQNYDLAAWIELSGKAETYVTEEDVTDEL